MGVVAQVEAVGLEQEIGQVAKAVGVFDSSPERLAQVVDHEVAKVLETGALDGGEVDLGAEVVDDSEEGVALGT